MTVARDGTLALVSSVPADPPESEDVSLRALAARAQQGDRQAFGLLYDQLSPALLSAARRFLGAQRGAEDLVHDVFLEGWQRIREYDASKASVRTWLLLRLRSRALDLMNKAEQRYTQLSRDGELSEQATSPSQDVSLEQRTVRDAVLALEEGVRAVLDQTYFDGLTAREIAERTGLPLGTVKSRLARGLAALQSALKPSESSDD